MTSIDRDPAPGSPDEGSEETGSRSSRSPEKRKKKHLPWWQESILLVVVAVGLAVLIKAVFLQAFYIPSESMEPGLEINDRILVQKVSYWGSGVPQRGDVVVFKDPGDWLGPADAAGPDDPLRKVMAAIGLYPTGGHLVKRVVGVGGDTIECCDDEGRLLVNGVPLDEVDYIAPQDRCNGPMVKDCSWQAGPIPDGSLFVMGDNRGRSADSSVHLCEDDSGDCDESAAFVPVDDVVGKVFVVAWPRDHMRWVKRPGTFGDVPTAAR